MQLALAKERSHKTQQTGGSPVSARREAFPSVRTGSIVTVSSRPS